MEASEAAGSHLDPDSAFILQSTSSRRDMAICLDANRTIINQTVGNHAKTHCRFYVFAITMLSVCLLCLGDSYSSI